MYYADKVGSLKDLFGVEDLALEGDELRVGRQRYPIVDDVIILCEPTDYTDFVRQRLRQPRGVSTSRRADFAEDIQFTFGAEWSEYDKILPEDQNAFPHYFDLIDLDTLRGRRVCDLGCGNGRWSYVLRNRCREIVLVDFSDAIFVARRNLADANNGLLFMCDLTRLPFRENFCDVLFCLGVLHTLPSPCLDEVRRLKRYAPTSLFYLLYALDNRPLHYRLILRGVTLARLGLSRIRSRRARQLITTSIMTGVYLPLIGIGSLLKPFGLSSYVPLYDGYRNGGRARLENDVYDRFFTRIEQRVSQEEIRRLQDTFATVELSSGFPYYHFVCRA